VGHVTSAAAAGVAASCLVTTESRYRVAVIGGTGPQGKGLGYRFAKGSTVRVELRGRTPGLFRPSNGSFSVALSDVRVAIPTHDRPSRSKGIGRPPRRN
jgi:hypothetical protein